MKIFSILLLVSVLPCLGQKSPVDINISPAGPEWEGVCTPCPTRLVFNINLDNPGGKPVQLLMVGGFNSQGALRCLRNTAEPHIMNLNYCGAGSPESFPAQKENVWKMIQNLYDTKYKLTPVSLHVLFGLYELNTEQMRILSNFHHDLMEKKDYSDIRATLTVASVLAILTTVAIENWPLFLAAIF